MILEYGTIYTKEEGQAIKYPAAKGKPTYIMINVSIK